MSDEKEREIRAAVDAMPEGPTPPWTACTITDPMEVTDATFHAICQMGDEGESSDDMDDERHAQLASAAQLIAQIPGMKLAFRDLLSIIDTLRAEVAADAKALAVYSPHAIEQARKDAAEAERARIEGALTQRVREASVFIVCLNAEDGAPNYAALRCDIERIITEVCGPAPAAPDYKALANDRLYFSQRQALADLVEARILSPMLVCASNVIAVLDSMGLLDIAACKALLATPAVAALGGER